MLCSFSSTFGAIAGSVMFGVNYAGGKIAGSNKSDATGVNIPTVSNNISNVAKTDSSLTEDTNLSASGKMDVEAVATAALPAMVQLNGTTTVKSSSYLDMDRAMKQHQVVRVLL